MRIVLQHMPVNPAPAPQADLMQTLKQEIARLKEEVAALRHAKAKPMTIVPEAPAPVRMPSPTPAPQRKADPLFSKLWSTIKDAQ